jgi:hypothetical protein
MTRLLATVIAALLLMLPAVEGRQAPALADSPAIKEINAAFVASYNLDHDLALARARHAVQLDPNSSQVQRGLASILWLDMLFWRGAMTVDNYLGTLQSMQLTLPKPDPERAAEFKGALARAIDLAERRLKQNHNDIAAMYDAGAAYGIQATYAASVEGGIGNAIRYARRAFDTQNEVLTRDPSRASAGLVVGTYRYVIATQPLMIQWVAILAGFRGNKDVALRLLEAASHDPLSRVDAKTALVLIYSREGRHTEAMRLAGELAVELPQNRLFVLEQGSAAIRAGRLEADQILTDGLARFEKDTRAKIPGEHALWLYKRGLARLNGNRPKDAAADLDQALAAGPVAWVEGRIHVALGQLADLAGRRKDAVAEYTKAKAICDTADSVCAAEAKRFLSRPFSFERR